MTNNIPKTIKYVPSWLVLLRGIVIIGLFGSIVSIVSWIPLMIWKALIAMFEATLITLDVLSTIYRTVRHHFKSFFRVDVKLERLLMENGILKTRWWISHIPYEETMNTKEDFLNKLTNKKKDEHE